MSSSSISRAVKPIPNLSTKERRALAHELAFVEVILSSVNQDGSPSVISGEFAPELTHLAELRVQTAVAFAPIRDNLQGLTGSADSDWCMVLQVARATLAAAAKHDSARLDWLGPSGRTAVEIARMTLVAIAIPLVVAIASQAIVFSRNQRWQVNFQAASETVKRLADLQQEAQILDNDLDRAAVAGLDEGMRSGFGDRAVVLQGQLRGIVDPLTMADRSAILAARLGAEFEVQALVLCLRNDPNSSGLPEFVKREAGKQLTAEQAKVVVSSADPSSPCNEKFEVSAFRSLTFETSTVLWDYVGGSLFHDKLGGEWLSL